MTKFALDIGNSHVIEWYLWQALRAKYARRTAANRIKQSEYSDTYFASQDWSRYDGELL